MRSSHGLATKVKMFVYTPILLSNPAYSDPPVTKICTNSSQELITFDFSERSARYQTLYFLTVSTENLFNT